MRKTLKGFIRILDKPDDVGQSEYRAIYEVLRYIDYDDPNGKASLGVVEASLDEFRAWADELLRRLKLYRGQGKA